MMSSAPANLRYASVSWTHDLVFEGAVRDGPAITIDGDAAAGPSPVGLLLLAAGACSGADVVSILEKMRAGLRRLRVEITGTRRDDHPKRFIAMHMVFRMSGSDLDATKARRAIDLSLEKYCSVVHTFAPDLALTHELILE